MDGRELKQTLEIHEVIARVYRDDRFPSRGPDTRLFAVTMLWVLGIERPEAIVERACGILHLDAWRFWRLIEHDVPRWESPEQGISYPPCEAPMIRRSGPCGQPGTSYPFRLTDPVTGEWRMASFCSRHREHGEKLCRQNAAQVRAGGIPEPVPNTGGLLPCYISWDWPELYKTAKHPSKWEPPAAGICADDWPVMAKVAAMEPPRLRLLSGDGEIAGGDAPSLRLVRN